MKTAHVMMQKLQATGDGTGQDELYAYKEKA